MFRRRAPVSAPVTIWFEGEEVQAEQGESLAAALLAAGVSVFRHTAVNGAARAPFCMIGNCFDCLVEIDGETARQSCLATVREGMKVRRQRRPRSTEPDD
ncbi:MAG: (2Fe-2S)-binding protein [Arenicellales bacterium]|jgi:predicted molibdopterin-dependent oxidoreductase YjgC|nr:(2Fe-2S)-binding protein [Arenicellales bacterium]